MYKRCIILTLIVSFLSGCSPILTPELVAALAKDPASFCGHTDLHGGAAGGALTPLPVVPLGGYGSGTLSFCRTNQANSRLTLSPDGAISIEHGVK